MTNTSSELNKRCLALGFFDGVHLGHAALLEKVKQRAAEIGAEPAVLSFDVHPDNLIFHTSVPLLSNAAGRTEIIHRCFGIDDIIFFPFNTQTMNMPWQSFAEYLVSKLGVIGVAAGYDFSFGERGRGNAHLLQKWCQERNILCDIIEPVLVDGEIVSSTYIRTLLENGEIEKANRFLGHPFCLTDTILPGYHVGTELEAPTINMRFPEGVLIPKYGVYAAEVFLPDGSRHMAVTNIGVCPTFERNSVTVESHILDYSGNLYGTTVRVEFLRYLRAERKFACEAELAAQIQKDIESVRNIFKK